MGVLEMATRLRRFGVVGMESRFPLLKPLSYRKRGSGGSSRRQSRTRPKGKGNTWCVFPVPDSLNLSSSRTLAQQCPACPPSGPHSPCHPGPVQLCLRAGVWGRTQKGEGPSRISQECVDVCHGVSRKVSLALAPAVEARALPTTHG